MIRIRFSGDWHPGELQSRYTSGTPDLPIAPMELEAVERANREIGVRFGARTLQTIAASLAFSREFPR